MHPPPRLPCLFCLVLTPAITMIQRPNEVENMEGGETCCTHFAVLSLSKLQELASRETTTLAHLPLGLIPRFALFFLLLTLRYPRLTHLHTITAAPSHFLVTCPNDIF